MTTAARDAKALLAVRLGDGTPLVPADAQGQGATAVVAAAMARLLDMKRARARLVYHRAPQTPEKGQPA